MVSVSLVELAQYCRAPAALPSAYLRHVKSTIEVH